MKEGSGRKALGGELMKRSNCSGLMILSIPNDSFFGSYWIESFIEKCLGVGTGEMNDCGLSCGTIEMMVIDESRLDHRELGSL